MSTAPDIQDLPIRQLRILSTLATTGSTSKTAEILGVSQPSVSKTITQLEETTGFMLIDRTVRPFKLTHAGIEILSFVDRILDDADQLKQAVMHLRTNQPTSLRLGLTELVCDYAGSDLEKSVAGGLASLVTQMAFAPSLSTSFANNEYDIVITSDIDPSHHLIGEELLSENFLVVIPKSFGIYEDELPIADLIRLLNKPFVTCCPGSIDRQKALSILRILGLPTTVNFALETTKAVARAVVENIGWTILPPMSFWSVRDRLDSLTVHPIPHVTIKRVTSIAAASSLYLTLTEMLRNTYTVRFQDTYLPQICRQKPCLSKYVHLT